LTSGRRPFVKIIAESLFNSQHDEKHVVPTLLSGIRVGGRRCPEVDCLKADNDDDDDDVTQNSKT
jgi:hypothetical protein